MRDKHSLSNYMVCNLLAVRLLRRGPCPLPCINNRYGTSDWCQAVSPFILSSTAKQAISPALSKTTYI